MLYHKEKSSFTDPGGTKISIRKMRPTSTKKKKKKKFLNLTKELRDADYNAVWMPVEVNARRFMGPSVVH